MLGVFPHAFRVKGERKRCVVGGVVHSGPTAVLVRGSTTIRDPLVVLNGFESRRRARHGAPPGKLPAR